MTYFTGSTTDHEPKTALPPAGASSGTAARRSLVVKGLVGLAFGLLLAVLPVADSSGQAAWRQTVQVIAPVDQDEVTGALVDSVSTALEQDGAQVQMEPGGPPMPYERMQSELETDGLSVTSATHVFITYRFDFSSEGTEFDILDLYFIYRPPNADDTDIPVLYVDLTDPETKEEMLIDRGVTLPYNEAAFIQFKEQISFHSLHDMATVVQVGNEIIRDEKVAAAEEQRILRITEEFTYQ